MPVYLVVCELAEIYVRFLYTENRECLEAIIVQLYQSTFTRLIILHILSAVDTGVRNGHMDTASFP